MKEVLSLYVVAAAVAVMTAFPLCLGFWAAGVHVSPVFVWGVIFAAYDAVTVVTGLVCQRWRNR